MSTSWTRHVPLSKNGTHVARPIHRAEKGVTCQKSRQPRGMVAATYAATGAVSGAVRGVGHNRHGGALGIVIHPRPQFATVSLADLPLPSRTCTLKRRLFSISL